MNIGPVGAELFHADGRTDMTKLIVTFRDLAKASKRHYKVQFMSYCFAAATIKSTVSHSMHVLRIRIFHLNPLFRFLCGCYTYKYTSPPFQQTHYRVLNSYVYMHAVFSAVVYT